MPVEGGEHAGVASALALDREATGFKVRHHGIDQVVDRRLAEPKIEVYAEAAEINFHL